MSRTTNLLAWIGVVVFVAWCMAPVVGDWSGSVLGPYGGADPMLQMGLLQWTSLYWHDPSAWLDLPIFHPVPGVLGAMDSLLGQAWSVGVIHVLFAPTAAALYNSAMVVSLLLAAVGMAVLWRANGGSWNAAGVAALAMVAAPFTLTQIGHLNQLPPPAVLFALAFASTALRRQEQGRRAWPRWWAVGASVALQAAWGWYGFAYAVVGVITLQVMAVVRAWRERRDPIASLLASVRGAAVPALLSAALVGLMAQPQLLLADRYPDFTRDVDEVRIGSADIQHVLSRGAYSSNPMDWIGRGVEGPDRHQGVSRPALHPGWITLVLALYGWSRRRDLDPARRRQGQALLVVGLVGFVFAFGDSVGVPGTALRLPLPLEWVRAVFPPFRAFRAAWRFSWLMVVAVAWWAAHGSTVLASARDGRRRLAPLAIVLLVASSGPAGLPSAPAVHAGHPDARSIAAPPGPVLALPATFDEFGEDQTEARWLLRAIELERPVTGGATGWVPPEIREFRQRLFRCEAGEEDAGAFLDDMRRRGYVLAELALREGDEARTAFWRAALLASGAARVDNAYPGVLESYVLAASPRGER